MRDGGHGYGYNTVMQGSLVVMTQLVSLSYSRLCM